MYHIINKLILVIIVSLLLLIAILLFSPSIENVRKADSNKIHVVSNIVNPTKQKLKFFWKDSNGLNYGNFQNLKTTVEKAGLKLIFATNGGMYDEKHQPKGLYIENGEVLSPLDIIDKGYGNFYLQPNGVFYIKNNGKAAITTKIRDYKNIKYATQSGPMLVIDNELHPKFTKNSKHKFIRNGVGILPDGNVLFALSKEKINLFDFASYFKFKGCRNALYLDGFVSRTYLPSKEIEQMDGNFGAIIGIVK